MPNPPHDLCTPRDTRLRGYNNKAIVCQLVLDVSIDKGDEGCVCAGGACFYFVIICGITSYLRGGCRLFLFFFLSFFAPNNDSCFL